MLNCNIVVRLDGGIGREICAIPAVELLAQKSQKKISIICVYPQVFENNPFIDKVYPLTNKYLWEDVISNGEFLYPEPYHNYLYYTQKHHLIQSFNFLLNGSEELRKPTLYLTEFEKQFAKQTIKEFKNEYSQIIAYQPFGSGSQEIKIDVAEKFNFGKNNPTADSFDNIDCGYDYIDTSGRSLSIDLATEIVEKRPEFLFLNFSSIELDSSNVINCFPKYNLRQMFSLIRECNYCLGVDSFVQHVAFIYNISATVILGSTCRENVTYADFTIIQKEGFPKEKLACRMPQIRDWYIKNENALVFDADFILSNLKI